MSESGFLGTATTLQCTVIEFSILVCVLLNVCEGTFPVFHEHKAAAILRVLREYAFPIKVWSVRLVLSVLPSVY